MVINKTTIKIPKKYHEFIEEVFQDSDGYWIHVKNEFTLANTDFNVQIVKCDTQKQVLEEVRYIRKVD